MAEAQAKAEAAVREEAASAAAAAKRERALDLQRREAARLAGEAAPPYAFPQKSAGMKAFLRRQAAEAQAAAAGAQGRQRSAGKRGGRGGAVQP